jgi:hypothetical protein
MEPNPLFYGHRLEHIIAWLVGVEEWRKGLNNKRDYIMCMNNT